jgi:signal transduction histidine kinase
MAKTQENLAFSIDARTIIQLGRDSIKNPTTALLELVKNGYDADASIIEVDIKADSIRIADNGLGMTTEQLQRNWLRIGYSEKRTNKVTTSLRRKTGEKGIGRLSTDRLGKQLSLRTKPKGTDPIELAVNWESFDVDGRDLSDILIQLRSAQAIKLPDSTGKTGTEILISGLRQEWLKTDIRQVYSELAALISPFSRVKDFGIIFSNDLIPELNGRIESDYYEAAELSLKAKFDGKAQIIEYSIIDKTEDGSTTTKKKIPWKQLSTPLATQSFGYTDKLNCGPIEIEMLFFSRTGSNPLLRAKGLTLAGLREFLDKNQGIKIYRDNISVKPYGYNNEPAGDWLGLAQRKERDPAGLNRPTWKVSSYQLVGAVSIGRDLNALLRDGASREGLVENSAFNDLRALTLACVMLLEHHRYQTNKEKKASQPEPKTAVEEVDDFKDDLEELQGNLEGLKEKLTDSATAGVSDSIKEEIEDIIKKTDNARQRVEDILDNNRVLSGLATIGVSAAVFGHETQTAISAFQSALYAAKSSLTLKTGPNVPRALDNLAVSVEHAKQVSSWGAFAISRVKKDKRTRRKVSVNKAVEGVLSELCPPPNIINTQSKPVGPVIC